MERIFKINLDMIQIQDLYKSLRFVSIDHENGKNLM